MVAIFIVLAILLMVAGVDAVLERNRRREAAVAPARQWVLEPVLPAGLFVHPGHTWAEIQRSGLVRVGLDNFVSYAVGGPDRVVLRHPGEEVRQGEPMLTVEQQGRQLVLAAPVSGTIEHANEGAVGASQTPTNSTSGTNWIYALKPSRLEEEIPALKVAGSARTWLQNEISRLSSWLSSLTPVQPGMAVQDGGAPAFGALRQLDGNGWRDFQKQFLSQ